MIMKNKAKRTAFIGVLTATALVLSYIEAILPPIYSAVPGIKVGLPNIVIIFILYKLGSKEAFAVSLFRVVAVSVLFGNFMTLAYSTAGAVLSLGVMILLKKTNMFSTVGVSIAGGVFHNLGQIVVAMVLLSSAEIGYYMTVLAITGTLAGTFIGLVGALLIKRTEKIKF